MESWSISFSSELPDRRVLERPRQTSRAHQSPHQLRHQPHLRINHRRLRQHILHDVHRLQAIARDADDKLIAAAELSLTRELNRTRNRRPTHRSPRSPWRQTARRPNSQSQSISRSCSESPARSACHPARPVARWARAFANSPVRIRAGACHGCTGGSAATAST